MNRARTAGCTLLVAVAAFFASVSGCLDRPVTNAPPGDIATVSVAIPQNAVDKIDLLVVVDNSASMGDKQNYLVGAIPELVTRLVTPNCVDPTSGTIYGVSDPSGSGACPDGGTVEFPPVHDLHIGVLTSSLGDRLGNAFEPADAAPTSLTCPASQTVVVDGGTISNHNDDRGELINRSTAAETPEPLLGTSSYLNYFPNVAANQGKQPSAGAPAITDAAKLQTAFANVIAGVGTYGCGIESQLESWYRFLIQPDPYDSLSLDTNQQHAQWVGVDTTILQQRHDFLRPDSLVAIIDLTDENDSEIDVRSFNGTAFNFMNASFNPHPGTSACDENAMSSGLVDPASCTQCPNGSTDPNCVNGAYSDANDWGKNLNLRHVRMMQKYGAWPQFPIQRYAMGLSSRTVPNRNDEYPPGAGSYQGLTNHSCTNPLFAASLPDGSSTDAATLCNLKPGTRPASNVYYAHIGGVPHQLLQQDPTNPDSPQKDTLTSDDWVKILGNNPATFDMTGIDPHMVESQTPRPNVVACPGDRAAADPISGYDWITNQGAQHVLAVDREYACIFPLAKTRDCTNRMDPQVQYGCDCPNDDSLTPAGGPAASATRARPTTADRGQGVPDGA